MYSSRILLIALYVTIVRGIMVISDLYLISDFELAAGCAHRILNAKHFTFNCIFVCGEIGSPSSPERVFIDIESISTILPQVWDKHLFFLSALVLKWL